LDIAQRPKEDTMKRSLALVIITVAIVGAHRVSAQEVTPAPGTLEVTVTPGGATLFTSKNGAPDFGNYSLGGALTYNINRFVGVEGEVAGGVGIPQDLSFNGVSREQKPPTTLNYSANLVLSASTRSSVVPYVTGGVGGLTVFDRPELDIVKTDSYLTGNAGGGVKWYAPNGRWGLRADYRFIALRGKDGGAAFLGRDDRYGHRVYGGVVINGVR
jgi:opacity protein-like surface antigen